MPADPRRPSQPTVRVRERESETREAVPNSLPKYYPFPSCSVQIPIPTPVPPTFTQNYTAVRQQPLPSFIVACFRSSAADPPPPKLRYVLPFLRPLANPPSALIRFNLLQSVRKKYLLGCSVAPRGDKTCPACSACFSHRPPPGRSAGISAELLFFSWHCHHCVTYIYRVLMHCHTHSRPI